MMASYSQQICCEEIVRWEDSCWTFQQTQLISFTQCVNTQINPILINISFKCKCVDGKVNPFNRN